MTRSKTRAFEFTLPEYVDRSVAADMAGEFAGAIQSGEDVKIDGSQVKQIGQAGLQALLSGFVSANHRRLKIEITQPSDALNAAASLAGASMLLGLS